ncbi:hypothetical protein FACS1894110_01000 [Spirochaetia bacterium]|nr:hypothetical protein FACS1894110_01000 [Spirochaetia bacterium]
MDTTVKVEVAGFYCLEEVDIAVKVFCCYTLETLSMKDLLYSIVSILSIAPMVVPIICFPYTYCVSVNREIF